MPSQTFYFTGNVQTFTVPGTRQVTIECRGAKGGDENYMTQRVGGNGAYARGRLNVSPGTVLSVYVGGAGGNAGSGGGQGGWNGGGRTDQGLGGNGAGAGGGGASDVRTGSALSDRRIVAGGGGGAGRNGVYTAGVGGHAGQVGSDGQSGNWHGINGGAGGGGPEGKGATQSAGGAGGVSPALDGTSGGLGYGGEGSGTDSSFFWGGGGGGGGYYGGGGGGSTQNQQNNGGGGGGGGSSYLGGMDVQEAYATGDNAGHGYIIISWTDDPAPTAPTLGTPTAGANQALNTSTPTFTWTHNDPAGDAQTHYQFRRAVSGGSYEYWNAASALWQSSPVNNPTNQGSVTFPAGKWPPGTYVWSVATHDGINLGPFAGDRSVVSNSIPNAPTLTAPANNTAPDLTTGPTFSWTHSDPEGNAQTHYALRRRVGAGAYEYWNAGTTAWQSTEVLNASAAGSVVFGANKWAAATTYLWSVRTQDSGSGAPGPYSGEFTVTGQANPSAPTLVSPANGSVVDAGAGFTFDWTFTDANMGDTQGSWAMRRKISGAPAYEYYNVGTAAWQSTEVWNTGASDQFTFPSGKWTNGQVYNWSVNTRDQAGNTGTYAVDSTFTASTPPTIAVTAPSGTVTGTTRPSVNWTYTDPESSPQATYQVKVFTVAAASAGGFDPGGAGALFDSGEVASAVLRTHQVGVDLPVGVPMRAYLRVSQTGQYTAWTFSAFTLATDTPAVPSVTATPDPSLARIALALQGYDNMVTANKASLEAAYTAADYEAGVGVALSRSTARFLHGSASLLASVTSAPSDYLAYTTGSTSERFPVVGGRRYTAIVSVQGTAGRSMRIAIGWKNAAGTDLNESVGAVQTVADGTWKQLTVTAVAPADAAFCYILFRSNGTAVAGDAFYFDALGLYGQPNPDGNLLHNPSGEVDTAGLGAVGSTPPVLTTSTAQAYAGVRSILATWATGSNGTNAGLTFTSTLAVVAGRSYTVSVAVYTTVSVYLTCYGTPIPGGTPATGTARTDLTNQWVVLSSTFVAPSTGTLTMQVSPVSATPAGAITYVDAAQAVEGTSRAAYYEPRVFDFWTRGGLAGVSTAVLERSDDGGLTWTTVRGGGAVSLPTPSQAATVMDYEAPVGKAVQYRARTMAVV